MPGRTYSAAAARCRLACAVVAVIGTFWLDTLFAALALGPASGVAHAAQPTRSAEERPKPPAPKPAQSPPQVGGVLRPVPPESTKPSSAAPKPTPAPLLRRVGTPSSVGPPTVPTVPKATPSPTRASARVGVPAPVGPSPTPSPQPTATAGAAPTTAEPGAVERGLMSVVGPSDPPEAAEVEVVVGPPPTPAVVEVEVTLPRLVGSPADDAAGGSAAGYAALALAPLGRLLFPAPGGRPEPGALLCALLLGQASLYLVTRQLD